MMPRPPRSTLFPYTTLFRSRPRLPGSRDGRVLGTPGRRLRGARSEEHTSELQSHVNLVCRLLREKKNARQVEGDAARHRHNLQDADLHHVAGLGAVDVDRPGHRVRPASFFFFFNDTATTEIYTLSLHDALPISRTRGHFFAASKPRGFMSQPSRSEEHTSELQSHVNLVCRLLLEKKKKTLISHYKNNTEKLRNKYRALPLTT